MSDHKDWATPENLYRAADNADAAGFTEYGWKLQGSAERIESLWAEIESLQRERDEAIANYTRDVPEFTHRIESQERVIERLKAICLGDESLSKWLDENEELRGLLSKQAEALADKTWPKSAITPEMRERIRRAELDAKEHLENGIWGVKDAISDLRWNRKSTAMIRDVLGPILRDLLGEQDA